MRPEFCEHCSLWKTTRQSAAMLPIDSPLDANGKLLPEVREACDRGVIFDVGAGPCNFGFVIAEKCMHHGFMPDTNSTDLNRMLAMERVYDLPTMVSRFLATRIDLDTPIACATSNPAKVFDYGVRIGTLRPESEADIAISELWERKFEFSDVNAQTRIGRQRMVNKAVVFRHLLAFLS
jgi:dihydroorotase